MFKRLRQHIKKTFQQPLEASAQSSFSEGEDKNLSVARGEARVETRKQLTDTEYEILFLELLAGVNNGWTKGNAKGFLAAKRVVEADLLVWLRGFGERLLELNMPNEQLAARMVQLGKLGIGQLGEVAREIGMQLLRQNESEPIREYEQAGGEVVIADSLNTVESRQEGQATPELDKLWELLGKKPSYTQQLSLEEYEETGKETVTFENLNTAQSRQVGQVTPELDKLWELLGKKPGYTQQLSSNLQNQTNQQVETTQVDQASDTSQSDTDLAELFFEEGLEQYEAGNFEAALVCFNQAITIKPDDHEAWNS